MDKVFLQIFNTALTAGWLVLAVILARLLLKKAPAWIKCALWAIVAVRLVWPFSIESVLSLLPSVETIPPSQLYAPVPQVHTGISSLNAAINPVFTETFRSEPMNSVNPLQVALWVAGWIWMLGMVAMAVYAAVSYLRISRRVRFSVPEGEGVYLCDQIPAPFILGILSPKIYLPANLPRENWDSIVAHERAHLARGDHWWKPLGFGLLTVFWFHPLLWVAYILLCRDVELACDERVIKDLSAEEKKAYSNTLLECSLPKKWITACPLAFGETGVKQRIKAVLHYKKPTLWILIIALIACTVLAVGFLTDPQTAEDIHRVYSVSELVYVHPVISFLPDLFGNFRVTEQNMLQYDYVKEYVNVEEGWHDVGRLEKITLTKENFDDLFHFEPMINGLSWFTVKQIRINNLQAWRVVDTEGCLGWDGYFLQQKNGDYYYLYGKNYLYKLTKAESAQPQMDIAGKTYIYEKEGAGSPFTLNLFEDGSFQYYAGVYSSHIGMGKWEVSHGRLYLHDEGYAAVKTFVFDVREDILVFCAGVSDRFAYVDVADGDKFYVALKSEAEQNAKQNLMWVQVESCAEDYLYVVDDNGDRWKIMAQNVDPESFILDHCWVSYCEEPVEINERLPGGKVVRYRVSAERCWARMEAAPVIGEGNIYRPFDCCYWDIDQDGITELCVLSSGHTSGISTFRFSVWVNGVCEFESMVYEGTRSDSVAFVLTESGLAAVNSAGKYFYFIYANGAIHITTEGLIP